MRALRQSVAWLTLAGFLSGQAAVWVAAHHAALEDDAECAAIAGPQFVGPHHQYGPQFEETNPPSPIEHCALCHLQRAVHSARFGRVVATFTAPHRVAAPIEQSLQVSCVVIPGFSPRGPPVFVS